MIWTRTAFSNDENGDGSVKWIGRGRLFQIVEWERLFRIFRLVWMTTTFFTGLNENGFYEWVEWEWLFPVEWRRLLND
jgi:hypothetical protein